MISQVLSAIYLSTFKATPYSVAIPGCHPRSDNQCLFTAASGLHMDSGHRAIYEKLYACLVNGSNLYTTESGNDFNKGTLYVRKSLCI